MVESTFIRGRFWDYKHIPNGLRALNWFSILVPGNAGGGVASSRAAQGYPVMELHYRTWGVGGNRGLRSIVNLCGRKWVPVIHHFQKQQRYHLILTCTAVPSTEEIPHIVL